MQLKEKRAHRAKGRVRTQQIPPLDLKSFAWRLAPSADGVRTQQIPPLDLKSALSWSLADAAPSLGEFHFGFLSHREIQINLVQSV
jgi:hypothetical protein